MHKKEFEKQCQYTSAITALFKNRVYITKA